MSADVKVVADYIHATTFAVLATIDQDGPVQRTIASFGNVGTTVYFATRNDTRKVAHIAARPSVSLLLQQEGQALEKFVNVAIRGKAVQLAQDNAITEAVEIIGRHSSRFRDRIAADGTTGQAFFRIDPDEVRLLDFARGSGPAAVSVVESHHAA
ncbi:MAG TPA: pyridoxamine 5'-phosphate oxidase family protein [Polyangiaceae bacterium]|nr:pyridoxamine 5'-phosphate oxidase family protein [Polyangiaceae bacterium]